MTITVGVLALQGGFLEHLNLLRKAAGHLAAESAFDFAEVRNTEQLARCDALVIPGGESTTMALVAAQSGLLEPLREFVKAQRRPTWGTCAGMILLAEAANATKKGGQDLVGGLDVRVRRNHFGRQTESFVADLDLPFLASASASGAGGPYRGVFIRAPVVERILPPVAGVQAAEQSRPATVVAPATRGTAAAAAPGPVDVLGVLPDRRRLGRRGAALAGAGVGVEADAGEEDKEVGDVIAVRQGNVFGTSFHPELTDDARIHVWWLRQVVAAVGRGEGG